MGTYEDSVSKLAQSYTSIEYIVDMIVDNL